MPASALGSHLTLQLPPSACGWGEKRRLKCYPGFNGSWLQLVFWGEQQTEGNEHGKLKGQGAPAHVSLWLLTLGSFGI